jgi:3-phenylpropionate/trans-cinnamate dioxygenase ferredoxin reductase subunit
MRSLCSIVIVGGGLAGATAAFALRSGGFAGRVVLVSVRGDVQARRFHAFWLADGRVVAAMNANLWDDAKVLRQLVESGGRADVARLADPEVPLGAAA